jgi:hypothetical protein
MKKKAIEKIPYFGLKKTSRKKDVKYIGVTAVKIVGHEKHLFLEVYRNKKESKEIPMVRIVLTKKDFGTYWPEKEEWTRQKIKPDSCYGRVIWGRRTSHMGAGEKRKYTPEHRGSGKDKEVLQSQRIQRGALVGIHIQT